MSTYVLYNPAAGNGTCGDCTKKLSDILKGEELIFRSVAEIGSYAELFGTLSADDKVIISGGDGTLHRFVNDIKDIELKNQVLYYAAGSGNDFLHDIGLEKGAAPVDINGYIESLPEATVNGETRRFINAVGYGIDGYCCEAGDEVRKKASGKPVNYTSIAIKGVLGKYRTKKATVIVDGVERTFDKVWLCPAMHGRFYGGGMNAAPMQDRNSADGKVTVIVWHGTGRLRTLMIFPTIFKGGHVKYTKHIDILQGHDVTVRFDEPCALQIDGETYLNVTQYSVKSSAAAAEAKQKEAVTV